MFGTILCVAAVTLGVDYGYEPNENGGLDYIIRIDDHSLESLKKGRAVLSDFPKDLRGLQTIRFQIGGEKPPRIPLSPAQLALLEPPPVDTVAIETQPKELDTSPPGKLMTAEPATYNNSVPSNNAPKPEPKSPDPKSPESISPEQADPEEPRLLLYCIIAGLAATLLYLSWVHFGMRSKYRALLAEHLAITQPT